LALHGNGQLLQICNYKNGEMDEEYKEYKEYNTNGEVK
jgi:hypothetical protein